MSAWEIPLAALQGYGPVVAVILPIVVTSHLAETLLLPTLVQHPRQRLREHFAHRRRDRLRAMRRSWHRETDAAWRSELRRYWRRKWRREKRLERRTRGYALARQAGAIALVLSGAFLTSLVALIVTRTTDTGWLRFAIYFMLATGLEVVHAFWVIRTAQQGARLYASHEAWRAKFKEDQHLWRILTLVMPLRAHDLGWMGLVTLLGLLYPAAVFFAEVDISGPPASLAQQGAAVAALIIVFLLTGALLYALEWVAPQLTLARWASDELTARPTPLRRGRQPVGPRVAPILDLCVRRRIKGLPPSLKDEYLGTCDKLAETCRIAHMQQNTRQAVHQTMRDALQYSARVAISKDASEATRIVDAWLEERGLADICSTPLPGRRRLPTIQSVGEVSDAIKKILATMAVIGLVVLLIFRGAGLEEIFGQFK